MSVFCELARRVGCVLLLSLACSGLGMSPLQAAGSCPAKRDAPLMPENRDLCASLESVVRKPGKLSEGQYQEKLAVYLKNYCHRNARNGWVSDKKVRDTGPFVGAVGLGRWSGEYRGTHAPVVIWYSPEAYAWLKRNRPDGSDLPRDAEPVPDGAMIVKEMFPPPAAACAGENPDYLEPTSGAAIMVRASTVSHDGWYWGWFGFGQHVPDWPATAANGYPNLGFGQYCVNCHASAKSNGLFSSLRNIKGHPGEPLVFLSQTFFREVRQDNQHIRVAEAVPARFREAATQPGYHPEFLRVFGPARATPPMPETVAKLPSETYDNVWAMPGSRLANSFVTSDQCLGCHAAGSTGLQFDMTEPLPGGVLLNHSPWATWRSSPMGLAGRDPFFYAQLESETQHFHPGSAKLIQDTCFGCHGVAGQRQMAMESVKPDGSCAEFTRDAVDATPLDDDPRREMARFGALARDGVTCLACHRVALGADAAAHAGAPQNACVANRQATLNPGLTGLARTFTGAFSLAGQDQVFGPYENPKTSPMRNALGMVPQHRASITSSEVCASCHVVHLPVLKDDRIIAYVYEQATYAEWLFSAYRTGTAPLVGLQGGAPPYATGDEAKLPLGPGETPRSCQSCHMPNRDSDGRPLSTKIASIQEYSNFPQAENVLPPKEIDLETRENVAKHTLVGLNVFLVRMAQQFSAILGNRTEDPMLARRGLPPLQTTENAILTQAAKETADIALSGLARENGVLTAKVVVRNKAGHKFPSGVGFRRAFVEFTVRDAAGQAIWSSGRTDAMGVIRDGSGAPVAGELWWDAECKARIAPEARAHQSHVQTIRRQDQVQIYQELVAAPGDGPDPQCGEDAAPAGPLTTSFLSVCKRVKDNRLPPAGYLGLEDRKSVAAAIGADDKLAHETGSVGTDEDADFGRDGSDTTTYAVPLAEIAGEPASVDATLYYQATPPFYMQDRFCTSKGKDADRLFLLAGFLKQSGIETKDWKLRLVTTGQVAVP